MDYYIIENWALAITGTNASLLHTCAHYTALDETISLFGTESEARAFAAENGIIIKEEGGE